MCKSQCERQCIDFKDPKHSTSQGMNTDVQKSLLDKGCITWNALLNSLKHENGFLILKLNQVIEGLKDKSSLNKAEYFQNEFITTDECITDLKKDIKLHQVFLSDDKEEMSVSSKSITNHEKLKNEIISFEKKFLDLKSEFEKSITGPVT